MPRHAWRPASSARRAAACLGTQGLLPQRCAHLPPPPPRAPSQSIFVDKRGMDALLDMLTDPALAPRPHREAASALLQLTKKLDAHLPGGCYGGLLRGAGARATRGGGVEPRARTDDAPLNPRGCWGPVGDGRYRTAKHYA
jgi:hypothetical protein